MSNCVTHHHACACREKATKDLIASLFMLIWDIEAGGDLDTISAIKCEEDAKKLGYING